MEAIGVYAGVFWESKPLHETVLTFNFAHAMMDNNKSKAIIIAMQIHKIS